MDILYFFTPLHDSFSYFANAESLLQNIIKYNKGWCIIMAEAADS